MYLPKNFQADERETRELLYGIRVADLVTPTAAGLFATFLPLLYDVSTGACGSLLGHVARRNDHWRLEPTGESLVIVHGPQGYISPGWYAAKREHGRVVPTWNYLTAHKAKLGQNRSGADIDGVVEGLRLDGVERLAEATSHGRRDLPL